jgi:hypothetical protein
MDLINGIIETHDEQQDRLIDGILLFSRGSRIWRERASYASKHEKDVSIVFCTFRASLVPKNGFPFRTLHIFETWI